MVTWILLLIGSAALFFVLEMLVFPKCFLKSKYSIGETSDRGIRKYKNTGDGFYFLYEPNWFVRRFIKQYVIAVEDGYKTLTCMLDSGVEYVRYDVVLFDKSDRVFRILNVQQTPENGVYTEAIELPENTAYVTLALDQVNHRVFPKVVSAKVPVRKLVSYGVATCITAVATAFCMNLSIARLFGKVFRESYVTSFANNVALLGVALAASVIGTLAISVALAIKNKTK